MGKRWNQGSFRWYSLWAAFVRIWSEIFELYWGNSINKRSSGCNFGKKVQRKISQTPSIQAEKLRRWSWNGQWGWNKKEGKEEKCREIRWFWWIFGRLRSRSRPEKIGENIRGWKFQENQKTFKCWRIGRYFGKHTIVWTVLRHGNRRKEGRKGRRRGAGWNWWFDFEDGQSEDWEWMMHYMSVPI